ncbi:FAM72 protein-domain-containing protein [Gongronella butleri]|nr:FAM72 protein-domain-containing protein [Gongronella butleri]
MLDNLHRPHRLMPMRQVWSDYQRMQNTATEYERKHVFRIDCRECGSLLTNRGMNAVLLSDRSIELFSTDLLPDSIGLVEGDYSAVACTCRVRDTACYTCGNIVGYHVNVPCKVCLSQPNNGHFWMFRSVAVKARPIFIQMTGENKMRDLPLLWGFVHAAGEFDTGFFKSGDAVAAHESCRLSVKLTSNIRLIARDPVTVILARSKDGDLPDELLMFRRLPILFKQAKRRWLLSLSMLLIVSIMLLSSLSPTSTIVLPLTRPRTLHNTNQWLDKLHASRIDPLDAGARWFPIETTMLNNFPKESSQALANAKRHQLTSFWWRVRRLFLFSRPTPAFDWAQYLYDDAYHRQRDRERAAATNTASNASETLETPSFACNDAPLPYPIVRHLVKYVFAFNETRKSEALGRLLTSAPLHMASDPDATFSLMSAAVDLSKPFVLLPFDTKHTRPAAKKDTVCVRVIVPPGILNPYPASEFHYLYEPYPKQIIVQHPGTDKEDTVFEPQTWWDMIQLSARHLSTNSTVPIRVRPWHGYDAMHDAFRKWWFEENTASVPQWTRDMMEHMHQREWLHVYEAEVTFPDAGAWMVEAKLEYQDAYWNVEHGPMQSYAALPLPIEPEPFVRVLGNESIPKKDVKDENTKNTRAAARLQHIVQEHLALPLCRASTKPLGGRWLPWPYAYDDPRMKMIVGLDRHGKFWAPYACRFRRMEHADFYTCLANQYQGKVAIYGDSNMRRSIKSFMTEGKWCKGFELLDQPPSDASHRSNDLWARLLGGASPLKGSKLAKHANFTTPDLNPATIYPASARDWVLSGTPESVRSCRCEDFRELAWDTHWFNATKRRQDFPLGEQVMVHSYKWDGLSFVNDPEWTASMDPNVSEFNMPRDSRLVILSLGNWDMAYMQLDEFRRELQTLVTRLRDHYDHQTRFVYRSPQYYCCRVDTTDRRRLSNTERLYAFDGLARHVLQHAFESRLVIWDTMHMGEARTWDEKLLIANSCPANHAQADVVHLENQVLMNLLCNRRPLRRSTPSSPSKSS